MNPTKKLALGAASVLAAGAIIGAGASLASADTTPSPSTSTSAQANSGSQQGPGAHTHTDATAEEAAKVKEAVKAKDSTVTIEKVQKDEDGSYDALGTKADGSKVMFDVSADLATVSEGKGGPGGGPGGASQDTPVTGDEAQKVIDAVKAQDSTVTVDSVRKDPDGSYDALGSKADGSKVMFDVSADLATVSEGKGGPGGDGRDGQPPTGSAGSSSTGASANGSTAPAN